MYYPLLTYTYTTVYHTHAIYITIIYHFTISRNSIIITAVFIIMPLWNIEYGPGLLFMEKKNISCDFCAI